jgi:hypothetical protein
MRAGGRVDTGPTVLTMVLLLVAAVPAAAQESEFAQVSNPFQEGFSYRVGEDLAPNVEVDGVRWRAVRIATKGDRDIEPDKNVGLGNGLERLRCDPPFKLAPGSIKEAQFKFKVAGRNLLGTRNLYLFCELQD